MGQARVSAPNNLFPSLKKSSSSMKSLPSSLRLILAGSIAALLAVPAANAAVKTWTGTTDATWNTGANWGGAVPVTADSLVFTSAIGAGGLTLSDNLMTPGTFSIAGITFNSGSGAYIINPATAGTNGFTLTGNVLNSSTSLQTINDLIATTAVRTFTTTAGGGNITLGGAISGTGGGITTAGTGTLTLGGINTYTGATTVNAGTLTLSGSSSASAFTVNGGTYNLTGTHSGGNIAVNGTNATSGGSFGTFSQSATGVISGATTLTINSSQVFGGTAGSATLLGNNTYTGTNTVGTDKAFNTASPYNIASLVAPTLTLSGANNGQATMLVNPGATLKLDFGAGGTAINNILNTTANTTGVTLVGSTLNITGKSGQTNSQQIGGTLTFGANTSNAVNLNAVGGGTLNVAFGAITRSAGSVLDFTLPTAGTVTTTTVGNIGTNKVLAASSNVAYATVAGTDWATNSGAATSVIGKLSSYNTNTFVASGDTDLTSNQTWSANAVNTLRFNTDGVTLTNSGANTVTSGGILITPNAATTGVTITGGTSIASGSGRELVIINNGKLAFNTAIADSTSGTSVLTIASSPGYNGVSTFGANNTIGAGLNVTSGSATFSGNNTIGGAVTVGYGATLTLSGSNTTTQSFTWGANGGGTLVLAGGGALGTGILNTNGSGAGQTNMVKFASDVQVSGGVSPTASINWSGGNGAFIQNYVMDRATAGTAAVNATFSSAYLNQAGTWNLLQGSNYTTGFTLPTLTVSGATTYGAANNVTTFNINASGANVSLGALAPITYTTALAGNVQTMNLNGSSAGNLISGVIANGAATSNITLATITQATVGSSTVTVSSATGIVQGLTLTGYSGITNGTIVTNVSGTTLTLSAPTTGAMTTAAGTVLTANVANLNKVGTGTWTLSGANTFSGQTAVNGGTLVLDYATNNNSKIALNLLTLNGGTLQLKGGSFAQTVASTTLGTVAGQTAITQNGGSSTIALGAITLTGGALDIGTASIATTSTINGANGLLGGLARVTVGGADWAVSGASGTNPITALASGSYTDLTLATGGVTTTNYRLTGSNSPAITGALTLGTLKIATSGTGQSLDLGSQQLTVGSGTAGTAGLLFTGSNAYTITSTNATGLKSGAGNIILQDWASAPLTLNIALNSGLEKYGSGKTILGTTASGGNVVNIHAGTLQYSADAQLGNTSSNTVTLNGSYGSGAALVANVAGGNITTARNIALGLQGGNYIDVVGNAGNTLTLSGVISGVQSALANNIVTFGGASAVDATNNGATSGIIALTAANTYSGGTTFAGGTVNLGVAENVAVNGPLGIGGTLTFTGGNLQYSASNNFDYSSRFSPIANQSFKIDTNGRNVTYASTLGGASSILTKTGAGTLTLSAANTYTGDTLISTGTIALGNNLALQNSAYDTTGSNGTTIGLNVTGFTTPTFGGLKGSVDLASAITGGYSGVTSLTLNPQSGLSATYSGIIANGASGMNLTKSGLGTQTLSGTNSYTGTTTINGGTLNLNNASALGGTTVVALNGGTLDNILGSAITSAASGSIGGSFTFGSGGATSANNLSLTGTTGFSADLTRTITLAGTGTTLTLGSTWTNNQATARTLTVNGAGNLFSLGGLALNTGSNAAITNTINGTGNVTIVGAVTPGSSVLTQALTYAGSGTLTLGGNNTFTGGLTINSGVVTLANAGALNSTTPNAVTFGASAPAGTKLQLGGNSVSVGALNTNATPGTPVIENASGTPATLTVTGTGTYAGVLQNGTGGGALSLTKTTGAGTLLLTGANSYTGATTVSAGTLTFSNAGNQSLGALDGLGTVVNAAGSGTLAFTQAASTTYNIGTITNNTTTGATGAFTLNGGLNSITTIGTISGPSGSFVNLGGNSTGSTTITNALNTTGQTVNFTAGTVNLNGTGANGSNLVFSGATVSTLFSGGFNYNRIASFNMSAGSLLAQAQYGFRMGSDFGAGNGATNAFTGTQSGGTFNITSPDGFQMGGNSGSFVSSYSLSGGTLNVSGGNLNLGAAAAGTGSTTFNLSGGKLLVSNTISGSQGSGAVQNFVFTGGQLTAGTIDMTKLTTSGSTTGVAATLANTGGTLAPGDIGTGGRTIITGAYTQSGTGIYAVDLGSATAATAFQSGAAFYDTTTVSGALTLGGNLSVSRINGFTPTSANTFTIISGTTGITGNFANVDAVGRVNLVGGGNMVQTASGSTVVLSGYAGGSSVIWAGGLGSNAWDIATTSNFTKTGVSSVYTDGDFATFNNTGITNSPVNLNTTVSLSGVVFANTSGTYTVTGSGKISGASTVTVQGAGGIVALNTANDYTGATSVTAGTLKLGNATALGTTAAGTTVSTGAVLDLNGQTVGAEALTLNGTGISSGGALINSGSAASLSGLVTLGSASSIIASGGAITLSNAGTITGATFGLTVGGANNTTINSIIGTTSGTLTKQDAGTLTLGGANTYTGLTDVQVGTLVATNATSLGTTAAGTTVTSGATLDVQANITTEAITVGGTGVGGNGALVASTGTGMVGGAVALTADTTLGGAGTLNVNGAVTGGFNLTKVGAGTTNFGPSGGGGSLAGVGNLTASAGTTNVNSVLGSGSSAVSVSGATTLKFGSVSQTLGSLTIGAGSTVTFTSGLASFSGGGGKAPSLGGSAVVPEPGTLGLLLVGALGVLSRRRRWSWSCSCSRGQ